MILKTLNPEDENQRLRADGLLEKKVASTRSMTDHLPLTCICVEIIVNSSQDNPIK
ncbi:MAG: hypothetical protein AB7V56_03530 [Candidatus Nitrosocosmicus sp.]